MNPKKILLLAWGGATAILHGQAPFSGNSPSDTGWVEVDYEFKHSYPILKVFGGGLMYVGDLRSREGLKRFWGFRPAFGAGLEQRFGKWLGLSANFMYGWVASEKRSINEFVNFKSRIINADVRTMLHFDYLLMGRQTVAPYVAAGVGYINFRTFSDLKDAQGRTYYLWTDGQLRDQPQDQPQMGFPQVIQRDYKYESDVTPARNNFLIFPVSAGFQFKVHKYWHYHLDATYFFTLSHFTNSSLQMRKDGYLFVNAGLRFFISQSQEGIYELKKIREKYKDALR
ncbi:MAG: hypothetical protein N2110_00710 [Flavobacteriales bacterium]|nr:hypothetical protein [Flavobacteriales bacterium]MCX7767531.1 hypothetical protein [Flavobacteriales bacterium]MDW8410396.1 hypothetical protein [Flavobacteriales bacterium]